MNSENTINDVATMQLGGGPALGRIDQYELVRELGGGGFGTVYLARDTVAGIEVAVKGLPPIIKNNAEELENIRANFALVSRLHHPYIAAALHLQLAREVHYAGEDVRQKLRVESGDTLMVMEYAPGVTLSKWRRQFPGGKVPLEQAIQLVWQIAQALDYAHEQHIIHRDIKPSNVMVETKPDGETVARLLDFGLAAEIRSSMGRVSQEVRDTSGTRPYMAPEQWAGRKQGPATDQYSLAALLCELLTGEVPFASVFETGDPVVMMTAVCNREVELPEGCPRKTALRRALDKEPSQRFSSCMEFVEMAAKRELVPRQTTSPEQKAKMGISRKAAILSTVMIVLGLTVIGGVVWHRHNMDVRHREQVRIAAERDAAVECLAREAAERKAKEKVELERKAAEAAARSAATEIRIEAKVQKAKVERISDADGFKVKKDTLAGSFARADALFDENTKRWSEAAVLFTNYVNECKALIVLDGERQKTITLRTKVEEAKSRAHEFEAEKYVGTRWNDAVGLLQSADTRFKGMEFTAAGGDFVAAAKQFMQCADEANIEKKQLDDEKARIEKVKAERERKLVAADNGHEKVQLWAGGPFWATTNIGAEKPEYYGYYFWWGDTVGYKYDGYVWLASDGSFLNFSFCEANTPICYKSIATLQSEGWITADCVLALEHDAAHVHWGGEWRMPTKQEFDDLNSKCKWSWTTRNGVKGYVVRGRGDYASAYIFLPAGGRGYETSLGYASSRGSYWSSVPSTASFNNAWYLGFDSFGHDMYNYYRDYGQPIRPVQGFIK